MRRLIYGTKIRTGLMKGRVRQKGVPEPSAVIPTFDEALQEATQDDLMWALNLLIRHPKAKRTWRTLRINRIAKRLQALTGQS